MRATTVAEIGEIIRDLRTTRAWTQSQLAAEVGVSREWISRIETGSRPDAEAGLLLRTLHALDAVVEIHEQDPSAQLRLARIIQHASDDS